MLSAGSLRSNHENHELPFMMTTLVRRPSMTEHSSRGLDAPAVTVRRCVVCSRRCFMTWQTPAATDWRFGFEISLYVANR